TLLATSASAAPAPRTTLDRGTSPLAQPGVASSSKSTDDAPGTTSAPSTLRAAAGNGGAAGIGAAAGNAASGNPGTVYTGKAIDLCETPSLDAMKAWDASPYRAIG